MRRKKVRRYRCLYGFTDRRVARTRKERGNKIGEVTGEKHRRRGKETELFSGKYAGSRFITASSLFKPCQVLRLTKIIKQLSDLFSSHHAGIAPSRRHFYLARTFSPLSLSLSVEKNWHYLSSSTTALYSDSVCRFRLSSTLISEFVRSRERPSCRRFLNRAVRNEEMALTNNDGQTVIWMEERVTSCRRSF